MTAQIPIQLEELKAVAQHSGWQIVQIQQDEGISGAKGPDVGRGPWPH